MIAISLYVNLKDLIGWGILLLFVLSLGALWLFCVIADKWDGWKRRREERNKFRVPVKVQFVKQDVWVGLYWKVTREVSPRCGTLTTWYLCLVPCLPIIWTTFQPCDHDACRGGGL